MPRLERQTFTWRLTLLAVWDGRREATAEDLVGMLRAVLPPLITPIMGRALEIIITTTTVTMIAEHSDTIGIETTVTIIVITAATIIIRIWDL